MFNPCTGEKKVKPATEEKKMSPATEEKFSGKDMFVMPDGSTYHLGAKPGQVAQRVVTVGSKSRAESFATLLDGPPSFRLTSARDMTTITGKYKGVQVTIIAIGMGAPMMDFMCREAVYCQSKPMAVIRVGTCGLFNPSLKAGTVCAAGRGSSYCYTNYARFAVEGQGGCANWAPAGAENAPYYLVTKPIMPDATLNSLLLEKLQEGGCPTYDGLNICGETFYSCQGRSSTNWAAQNEHIVEDFEAAGVDWCEMETHQLLHCAQIRRNGIMKATGCAIGIVSRTGDSGNITEKGLKELELACGKAALETLINYSL